MFQMLVLANGCLSGSRRSWRAPGAALLWAGCAQGSGWPAGTAVISGGPEQAASNAMAGASVIAGLVDYDTVEFK
jgi:hypothetical protein